MKAKNQKKVFDGKIQMETQTVFESNGNITIHPCEFELGQQITANSKQVNQRGRMKTEADGTSHFHPYVTGSPSKYSQLWGDPYSVLKMSKTRLVLVVNVPLDLPDPYEELSTWATSCLKGNTDGQVEERINEASRNLFLNKK